MLLHMNITTLRGGNSSADSDAKINAVECQYQL